MKLRILAGVVVASLLFASAASASTVTISKQQSDVFAGGGASNVTLRSYNGLRFANGKTSVRVAAGGLRVTDGANDFVAWCLDVAHWFRSGSQYSDTSTPFSASTGTLSGQQVGDITKLFSINYKDLDLDSDTQSAGFQLALWEIVNEEWGAYDLEDGSFRASRIAQSAIDFANDMLDTLWKSATQSYELTFYEANKSRHKTSQNLVSVTPVPLPAAGLLLGAGLAGLYGVGRRRKVAKTTA